MQLELQIFIDDGCLICDEARRLASLAQEKLPHVQISLINVSSNGATIPEQVFAVPTYMMNGKTLWLGNPDELEFLDRLRRIER
jgi:hypothetical protein